MTTVAPQTVPANEPRPVPSRKRKTAAVRSVWRQPLGLIGAVIIVLWIATAALSKWIVPYDPLLQAFDILQSPSTSHWFGTDELGRDVFSRVIAGSRLSVPIAVMLVACAMIIGVTLGSVAAYFGRFTESVIMRATDLFFAFPAIILAMAIVAALGPDLVNAVLAIVVVSWPSYARVSRSLVLMSKSTDYVLSARLLGIPARTALFREIRPNVAGPLLVLGALDLGNAVLLLSGLSFLGLGTRPPTAEWGSMVSEGTMNFDKWWIALFPGLAILTVVLAFNFVGDTIRDALDPRLAKAIGS